MVGCGTRFYWGNRAEVYKNCQVVACGTWEAVRAAARLLNVSGTVCITPTGRFDGHGKYVRAGIGGPTRCEFCKMPV